MVFVIFTKYSVVLQKKVHIHLHVRPQVKARSDNLGLEAKGVLEELLMAHKQPKNHPGNPH